MTTSEEAKNNKTITEEYDYNKGNIRKVKITYNQDSVNKALERIVLSRLKKMKVIE